jgi:glycosyltransferase involved in cell wall biosynthesis
MKVLVVNNMEPFVRGGAEELADHLVSRLNLTPGVKAELLRIPFRWEPAERLVEEILLCSSLHLYNVDLVLGLKFPAYLVPHQRKRLWLLHQFRQAYDLWECGGSNIPKTERGRQLRQAVITADNHCFSQCEKIFGTRTVGDRLHRFNGFDAELLVAPLNYPDLFHCDAYDSYLFCGGRINPAKRQFLLVEAMRLVRSNLKIIVAGPPETPADGARLRELVERHGLSDKVTLDLGFLPRERIARYVNEALACAYLPLDEDSVGYVTMEAFAAGKSVLTATDCGGVLDIVIDGETGVVSEPDPRSLASAIDKLAGQRSLVIRMGREARALWTNMNITWPGTVERLLA